jgi:ABC-type multidrug transport system fused ATPase/permease subunit
MGTILNKMIRGVNSTAEFIKSMTNNFLPYFLTALITIIVLAKYSLVLSLLLLVLFPAYIFISHRSSDRWRQYEDKKNTISDISQGRVGESLVGIRVIKAFAREVVEISRLVRARVSIEDLTKDQSKNWHLYDFSRRILLNIILLSNFKEINCLNGKIIIYYLIIRNSFH